MVRSSVWCLLLWLLGSVWCGRAISFYPQQDAFNGTTTLEEQATAGRDSPDDKNRLFINRLAAIQKHLQTHKYRKMRNIFSQYFIYYFLISKFSREIYLLKKKVGSYWGSHWGLKKYEAHRRIFIFKNRINIRITP